MELSTTTTVSNNPTASTILFGKNGSNPLPMLEKLWDFYSSKGNKTVFVNIGTSSSPLAELEIAESLGCPIHTVEPDEENRKLWNKVLEILKTRKISEETECDFTKNVSSKWVLSKNIHISSALPFFYDGLVQINDIMVDTVIFKQFVKNICSKMNISEEQERIDLVNLNDQLRHVLQFNLQIDIIGGTELMFVLGCKSQLDALTQRFLVCR
jgi:hypothetical protein